MNRHRTAETITDLLNAFSAWAGVYSTAAAGAAVVSLTAPSLAHASMVRTIRFD